MESLQKVYFLGIGGIGMSAIARYFLKRGVSVSGYDKTPSPLTGKLESEGMKIQFVENVEHIPVDVQLVIWTPAIPADSVLLNHCRHQNFLLMKRAEVLGWISKDNKSIAVAGTHGKTTTSSLLAYLLTATGVDCTAFLGGIAVNFDSNFISGSSEWVVLEADEYDRSFLQLSPDIAILTSMDADHLDIYGDASKMLEGFIAFSKKVKQGGRLHVEAKLKSLLPDSEATFTYGVEMGDYRAVNVKAVDGMMHFDVEWPEGKIVDCQLPYPGLHNVENAIGAISVLLHLKIENELIKEALLGFRGIKRRFELIHKDDQRVYIDDYAHHPSELKAAIQAARMMYPGKKLAGIFQPHLYTRTRDFADGFAKALDELDELWMLDIYPAREKPLEGVSSEMILNRMNLNDKKLVSNSALMKALQVSDFEILMTLGAGDIDRLVPQIDKEIFKKKYREVDEPQN